MASTRLTSGLMPQHDPETLRIGRENIARPAPSSVAPKREAATEPVTRPTEPDPPADDLTADRIQVEMATAEERDQMRPPLRVSRPALLSSKPPWLPSSAQRPAASGRMTRSTGEPADLSPLDGYSQRALPPGRTCIHHM